MPVIKKPTSNNSDSNFITSKVRLCIDYRKLNAVTKPDRFPLPNLNDAVFSLHGMKYFTCLDLASGFYHFKIHQDSREFTAFSTSRAHWQFKSLSFGLKNTPAAFQREMQSILGDFPWRQVICYIDDIATDNEPVISAAPRSCSADHDHSCFSWL